MTAGPSCSGWERNTGNPWSWLADCGHDSCWAIRTGDVLPVPSRPAPRRRRSVRAVTRDALWAVSDRLCRWGTAEGEITCRPVFRAGNLLGEAGWKLRDPS